MTACNLAMAFLFFFNQNLALTIVTIMYLAAFTTTTGPASFAFCIEVNTDIALGVAMAQLINSIGLFFYLTQRMINGLDDNQTLLYFIFAIYGALALNFSYKFIKETKGLSDKEKKSLYALEKNEISTQTTSSFEPSQEGALQLVQITASYLINDESPASYTINDES